MQQNAMFLCQSGYKNITLYIKHTIMLRKYLPNFITACCCIALVYFVFNLVMGLFSLSL